MANETEYDRVAAERAHNLKLALAARREGGRPMTAPNRPRSDAPTHTPGPWTHRRSPNHTTDVVRISPNTGALFGIADCYGLDTKSVANARLIAAAPMLLEAARASLRSLDRLAAIVPATATDERRIIATTASELRAAIAAATGGQS